MTQPARKIKPLTDERIAELLIEAKPFKAEVEYLEALLAMPFEARLAAANKIAAFGALTYYP